MMRWQRRGVQKFSAAPNQWDTRRNVEYVPSFPHDRSKTTYLFRDSSFQLGVAMVHCANVQHRTPLMKRCDTGFGRGNNTTLGEMPQLDRKIDPSDIAVPTLMQWATQSTIYMTTGLPDE
ncbi:hypothetical protein N7539_002581 [Penicillium diatomitis]|uniref:Uncharacterized protein n=1 Tax=Penicillium diatomitis TaxID=2819901 RepID=A0A9W9XF34_9EURO|nr:uncharacterized protein N7539_002581 [Penicillium diatomitis]KAJ5491014.1 hypothetical protein N7539_002581 [Penicillium diatomitis]